MRKPTVEEAIELAKRMTREQASVMYRKMKAQRRLRMYPLSVTQIARESAESRGAAGGAMRLAA